MVKIRLKRLGRKKRPFYRIVVINSREKREGAPLAQLGYYNPLSRELKLDKVTAQDWIKKGAEPTEPVVRLLKLAPETGELIVLEKAKKEQLSKKAKARLEQEAQAKAEAAAAPPAPAAEEAPSAEPEAEAPAAEEVPSEGE